MPVSDFECQIARGQIGRYVEGGALSPQAMTGLEEHLAECPACKALVAERRAALLGTLSGAAPSKAVVEMPVENPLVAALREKQKAAPIQDKAPEKPKAEAPKTKAAPRYATKKSGAEKKPLGKPLALAALLAVVLLGMSRVSQFVGAPASKASMSFAAGTTPLETPRTAVQTPEAKPETTPAATPAAKTKPAPVPATPKAETPSPAAPKVEATLATGVGATSSSTPKGRPLPAQGKALGTAAPTKPSPERAPSPAATPRSTPARPVVKRVVRKAVKRKALARRASRLAGKSGRKRPHSKVGSRSTVRVYGADGRPLN